MISQGVADVFTSLIFVCVIRHRVLGNEFVASPVRKPTNSLDRVLCSGSPDECHIFTSIGTQAFGALAQNLSTRQVIGTDKGESGVLELRAIKI